MLFSIELHVSEEEMAAIAEARGYTPGQLSESAKLDLARMCALRGALNAIAERVEKGKRIVNLRALEARGDVLVGRSTVGVSRVE